MRAHIYIHTYIYTRALPLFRMDDQMNLRSACRATLERLDIKMKWENAWPDVFLFYLKFPWAVTLHCAALTSTRPTPTPAQGARRPVWGNAVHTMLNFLAPPPPPIPLRFYNFITPNGVAFPRR